MHANLAHQLIRTAWAHPDGAALFAGTTRVATFAQLADRAARCARGLRLDLGLAAGDRVALVMKNCPQYVELLYGIWHAGLCAVPINAKLHPREIDYILRDSGARVTFVTEGMEAGNAIAVGSPAYEELFAGPGLPVAEVGGADLAWLFYTSGTTGKPKGVMLSHRNLAAMAEAYYGAVTHVAPDDRLIHAAPMSHGSGLYIVPYIAAGAAQVVPPSGGFDAEELSALVAAHPRAGLFAAPTMLNRLVEHVGKSGADLANLKVVVCGGAPLYLEDALAALDCLGPKVAQIYGQGESPMTITAQSASQIATARASGDFDGLASVGRPCPGVEVCIADADDNPLPAGAIGEVLVRGATVMAGYWHNPEASAATLRNGWLHTGDVGCLDDRGRLTLKDRSKDVIISGGSNIYPREVEDALLGHPGVAEVSVLGRRHPDWGEEVVAIVVPRPGTAVGERELDQWCLTRIARFKRPKAYLFLDELPKNSTGKVLKTALRGLLAGAGDLGSQRP
ncbi:MAG TPA: AMP-binding protein [Rhodocyclaceae bacterium]|nr:AMP-binding protein [Rhodocyclaceae bacterium]